MNLSGSLSIERKNNVSDNLSVREIIYSYQEPPQSADQDEKRMIIRLELQ